MSAREAGNEARVVLAEFLIEHRSRGHKISAYLFDPYPMADALLAAGWTHPDLLPVPQPDDDTIELAAEVIYDTWIDNGDCGRPNWMTEAAKADARDQARALAAAGLLAPPTRGESA